MLYEKAFQKGLWEAVRAEKAYAPLLSALLEDYRAVSREGPVSAVRFSEYIIYQETGSRKKYEAAYFARRKRLNTYALMALVYPEEGEHLLQLQDTVWAICDEYTWALPAHIAWRTGRDPGCIDLFSAETGFALSMIRHLLGDRLHEKMKERIDWEINRRIIRPFLYRRFWWEHSNNNWAAVCAGIGGLHLYAQPPAPFLTDSPTHRVYHAALSQWIFGGWDLCGRRGLLELWIWLFHGLCSALEGVYPWQEELFQTPEGQGNRRILSEDQLGRRRNRQLL